MSFITKLIQLRQANNKVLTRGTILTVGMNRYMKRTAIGKKGAEYIKCIYSVSFKNDNKNYESYCNNMVYCFILAI